MSHNPLGLLSSKLLITRPKEEADRLALRCKAFVDESEILICPVQKVIPLGGAIEFDDFSAVLFTSKNAVACAPMGMGKLAFCVGDATAQRAREKGYNATSAGGNVDRLFELVMQKAQGKLLYLHGTHTRGDLAQRLLNAGFDVKSQRIYDQQERAWSEDDALAVARAQRLVLPVFSPRSATLVAARLQTSEAEVFPIFMSQAVAQAYKTLRLDQGAIVDTPKEDAMVDKICEQFI